MGAWCDFAKLSNNALEAVLDLVMVVSRKLTSPSSLRSSMSLSIFDARPKPLAVGPTPICQIKSVLGLPGMRYPVAKPTGVSSVKAITEVFEK